MTVHPLSPKYLSSLLFPKREARLARWARRVFRRNEPISYGALYCASQNLSVTAYIKARICGQIRRLLERWRFWLDTVKLRILERAKWVRRGIRLRGPMRHPMREELSEDRTGTRMMPCTCFSCLAYDFYWALKHGERAVRVYSIRIYDG